jgi:hypothetical protein
MKHAGGAFSFVLILGSMTLLAQSSGRDSKQPAVARVVPGSLNCPVDMQAQRQVGVGELQKLPVRSDQPAGPAQELRLTLTNPTFREIVGVRITAYGLNSKPQLSPARATAEDSSAIDKSFDLKIKVAPKSETSADLSLPGFTSVTLINVDSIHYAGGSTWAPSALHTCHVVPNAVMLISSR